MPKLWSETIEAHRQSVHEAILHATAELVHELGLTSVTMSAIAERAGIGRATLYKYFPDLDAILDAWHQRQIDEHLRQLTELRDHADDPAAGLEAVLEAYARIAHDRAAHDAPGTGLVALMHHGREATHAHQRLHQLISELVRDAAAAGDIRDDIAPDEIASYCVHALDAAADLPSKAAVHRLVTLTIAGLRPQR